MQRSGGAVIRMQPNFKLCQYCVGDEKVLREITGLPVAEPFSAVRMNFLDTLSKELLTDRIAKLYPDVITFAFWIRKANMEKKKTEFCADGRYRLGRGVVFHIAPSNVAVNYAYSFALGFIMGNANIVRLPSKEFKQVDIIDNAIHRVFEKNNKMDKELKPYIVFLRYGREKEINDYLSSICDVRIIWGGDRTISEIRNSALAPRANEVTFADRYSISIVDAKAYLNEQDKSRIAHNFYNDTYLTDQNACSSPRIVCWLGEEDDIGVAKDTFWAALHDVIKGEYHFQPVQFVDKLTEFCLASVNIEEIHKVQMEDNFITRIHVDRIDDKLQEFRGNSGYFYEYDTKNILDLLPLCNSKLQTISYIGSAEIVLPLIKSGVRGIDRVVKIGETMDFDFVWDGYNLVERLSRTICGCHIGRDKV